jgi:hypothetical protein
LLYKFILSVAAMAAYVLTRTPFDGVLPGAFMGKVGGADKRGGGKNQKGEETCSM